MSLKVYDIPLKSVAERRAALESGYPEWPRQTIATHFSKQCEKYTDRPFLHTKEATSHYGEIWDSAWTYAKAFMNLGVKRRDHIAILMENSSDYISLMIASSLVGAVTVPINTMLNEDELDYILSQSDSKFLITEQTIKNKNYAEAIGNLLNNTSFQERSILEKVVCIPTTEQKLYDDFLSWDNFKQSAQSVENSDLQSRWDESNFADEVGMIIYTSGSTGKSKGVMLTHDMILRCAYSTCISRAHDDGLVTFAALPFYHCFAIIEGIFAMSFVGGAIVSAPRFSPIIALEMMDQFKANDFLCVPSMLVPLLNEERVVDYDLSNLYSMWCGAAPAPVPVWEKAMDVLGLTEIITGYGQTEVTSSGVTTEVGDALETISSRVGRPKLGGVAGLAEFDGSTVQYKTIDRETGEDLPEGSIGELAVRGVTVTKGYYNKPLETAEAIDKDGWLRTGDVGLIHKDGYIELIGRDKDIYKVSGLIVSPGEIEEVISRHPAVNQVAVIGVANKITTEAGAAFIELKKNESVNRREIINWCSERLARFKLPRHVWFIEPNEWPMTATGKIQKFRLKDLAKEKLSQKEE